MVDTGKGTFVLLKNEIDSGVPYLDSTVDSGDKLVSGFLVFCLLYFSFFKTS